MVGRFYEEVINKKNVDAIDELFSPDFLDHSPAPGQAQGVQGVKDSFAMFAKAFPDLRVDIEEILGRRGISWRPDSQEPGPTEAN